MSEFEGVKIFVMHIRTSLYLCTTIIMGPAQPFSKCLDLRYSLPRSFFTFLSNDAVNDAVIDELTSNKHAYIRRYAGKSQANVHQAYSSAAGCLVIDSVVG
jgi:hypothetical protein